MMSIETLLRNSHIPLFTLYNKKKKINHVLAESFLCISITLYKVLIKVTIETDNSETCSREIEINITCE